MKRRPLDAAGAYTELGLRVIPLCGPACGCKAPGKRPWDPTAKSHMVGWQQRGVPTAAEVDAWLGAAGADRANLGCLTGHGLVWLDVDGPEGERRLAEILGPNPPATWEFSRGPNSRRLVYSVPDGMAVPTIGGDGGHAGLRILGDGAQSVLPPSRHRSGDVYTWAPGRNPWTFGPAAPAPAALLELLTGHRAKGGTASTTAKAVPFSMPASVDVADLTTRVKEVLPDHLCAVLDRGPEACPGRFASRSEGVFALVGSFIANGIHDQVGAAVLAAQPWVAARYDRDPLGGLLREFSRARAAGAKTWYIPGDLRLTVPLAGEGVGPSGQPAPRREPEVQTVPLRDRLTAAVPEPARAREKAALTVVPPAGCAQPASGSTGDRYDRHSSSWGLSAARLRTFDPERDAAVRAGLGMMRTLLDGSVTAVGDDFRLARHLDRLLESFDRCRTRAWGSPEWLRQHRNPRKGRSTAWAWSKEPCDGRGHETCSPYHGLREIGDTWGLALEEAYTGPVAVISLTAPGWGLMATRRAAHDLIRCAAVKAMLPFAAGYLIAAGGREPGYSLNLIVPASEVEQAERVLAREWRKRVLCGWVARVEDLPHEPSALEALIELRVRSEQALPLLVAAEQISLAKAVGWYALETGANSGSHRGGQMHRIVVGPGLRRLKADLEGGEWLQTQAVGAEDEMSDPVGVDRYSTAPARGTGAGGGPAASQAPADVPHPDDDDDTGWRPCPWDPELEMKKIPPGHGYPRRLPWYVLEDLARRGLAEPIIRNGRHWGFMVPEEHEEEVARIIGSRGNRRRR